MTKREITVTGATGSIGSSCCDVVRQNPERLKIVALSGFNQIEKLAALCREFKPAAVAVKEGAGRALKDSLGGSPCPNVFEGAAGLTELTAQFGDTVVAGVSGSAGIHAVIGAVDAGKAVVLANKESLVLAGRLIMSRAQQTGARILPMDSEHNAIYQALGTNSLQDIDHVVLTSSGGPFFHTPPHQFITIRPEQALKHPNWVMGQKITIDSATMMNKALEIIEAARLFNLTPAQIKVVIHPEVAVHSAVMFKDGSMLAQLGTTDMRIPAAFCLGVEQRILSGAAKLDLAEVGRMHFYPPDLQKFPTLSYAYQTLEMPDSAAAALNGANEFLVAAFLAHEIRFTDIFWTLGKLIDFFTDSPQSPELYAVNTLKEALQANHFGFSFAGEQMLGKYPVLSKRDRE